MAANVVFIRALNFVNEKIFLNNTLVSTIALNGSLVSIYL